MHRKLIPLLLLFCLSRFAVYGQVETNNNEQDLQIIKSFLLDVADESLRPDVILSKHVLIQQTTSDEGYDYLEASINEIRLNLQTKNMEEIQYVPFLSLPKKEVRDIDPEGKPVNKMYFLRYRDRQMLAIYLDEGKIASFTLVSKGNKVAHFVTY